MIPSAVILAGSRPGGDPFAQSVGVSHKALIELEGCTLLERVVTALREAGIERVAVSCNSGPVADLAVELKTEVMPAESGPSKSVAAAFEDLGPPLIVTTCDHALLRSEWVRELVEKTPESADISVMLAERAEVGRSLASAKRTYIRFSDGDWSGCNLFYLQTANASRAIDIWSKVEADRKRPWLIAARLGVPTLFQMLLRRLSLSEGLERLGSRIGIRASLVAASDGLAAVDVDKLEDLRAVQAILRQQNSATSAGPISR
jgi:GTP:adenosylcobinamide-phosphate guanylyltransferase